ncbi:hypothetical protein F4821DRAFT_279325 [Hypoxylon rubiginosum]|uniref:Uncharacterized protein n=1 Tax=Hypoxylon rubiginosum TaxID=110542 RepID=A0ACC0CXT8_9PEZI|nr:hypothetical protein F4821DRAFT_279325 [Hypoxylon rubiginosum]
MQDQGQEADFNNGLRLEDVSRRSACDRCRGLKMRCERPHNQSIVQLQECRRCRQAEARCITTLEAPRSRNRDATKTSQKTQKRRREPSIEANTVDLMPENLDGPTGFINDILTPPAATADSKSKPLPWCDIGFRWQDLERIMDLEGSSLYTFDYEQARVIPVPMTSNTAISAPDHKPDSRALMDSTIILPETTEIVPEATPILSNTMQVTPEATTFNPTPQESCEPSWNNLRSYSTSDVPGPSRPSMETNRKIMAKLMEFNTKVVHDLQDDDTNSILAKTLQHSTIFLELLESFMLPEEAKELNVLHPTGANTAEGDEKWDTEVALLLLSCNTSVNSMYKTLCTKLETQAIQDDSQALLGLRLEGLQSLDKEMRVQVIVHICSLTFIKIQKQLGLIRRCGLLTQTADRTFQVVLGSEDRESWSSGIGSEQMVDNLRRLVMPRGL